MTQEAQKNGHAPRHAPAGQLFLSDGTVIPAGITYWEDGVLLVTVADPGALDGQPMTGLTLESTGGRGVLRTPGTGQRLNEKVIRFMIDEQRDIVQRREFVRVSAALRVIIEDEEQDVIADTRTVDLSGGGMLINVPRRTQIPQDFYFALYFGDSADMGMINGTARLVRMKQADQAAISFVDISSADRERLIRFIFDRQRAALAITRGDSA